MRFFELDTPVGSLRIAGDEAGLRRIQFSTELEAGVPASGWRRDAAAFPEARRQLQAYFAGELRRFDLLLAPVGTEFQLRIWTALQAIPYGQTVSYGELARAVGRAGAARAVGAANGANPIPVVIPCHRVIGSTGKLTGFGGGLPIKAALLDLEQRGAGRGVPTQSRLPL
jgi:methylated-DNA-[protein]-cysteine S-methyltransferase